MFPLAPLRRSTIIAVPGAGVKCGSTRRSSISSLALPNLREERWLCLSLGVLAVTESLWNTPGSKVRPKGAKFSDCDLAEIIAEVLGKPGLRKRRQEINVDVPGASLRVAADRQLILRVIQNLVANALGFTAENGRVRIGAQQAGAHVRVLVEDNGPGIPPEYLQKIFEKFGQVKARKEHRKYSTGLGLTFCKLVVEAHGGRIGVTSEEGMGSTFWFELPQREETGSLPHGQPV